MKKILLLLPILFLFSCQKEKIDAPKDELLKVLCYADELEEGESVTATIDYKCKGEPDQSKEVELSVHQGVIILQAGVAQIVNCKSLSITYETADQLRVWHVISNMNQSETYEEVEPISLDNTVMQFDYFF